MSVCQSPEIQETINALWDEMLECKHRIEEIEQYLGLIEIKPNFNNIYERISKLEGYMDMEDRITASSIIIRLSRIEDKIDKLENNFPRKINV